MDSPLRVALVGPCPADLSGASGGIEAVVALLARGLAERGERVEVLTCDFEAATDRLLEVDGVRLHRLATRGDRDRGAFRRRERRWIRRRLAEISPDLVHAHGTDFHAEAALHHPAPNLLTVYGETDRQGSVPERGSFLRRLSRVLRAWAERTFEERSLARATEIVVPNRHLRARLERRAPGRLHEIPHPIDPTFFDLPDRAVPGRLLCVGAIRPGKGLLDLVRALPAVAKERPDVRLHVVGRTTDPSYAAAVKAEIERARLDRFVVWRGPLEEYGLLEAYSTCSVLVLPSAEEPSPLVVAQAMAAGKPVVAHPVGAVPSLVGDGASGLLVRREHPTAMADALLALLEDETRRRELGERAAELARERFDPGFVVERTAALYREVVARSPLRTSASLQAVPPAEELLAALPSGRG